MIKSYNPKNIKELANDLSLIDEKGKIVGGGTDLVIEYNLGKIKPTALIAINNVKEAKTITIENDIITIGASCTMYEIHSNEIIQKHLTALKDASIEVGSMQIRNSATIGGNICQGTPAQDLYPSLFMYDAKVVILQPNGEVRHENIKDFLIGVGKTTLKYNEAVVQIKVQVPKYISHYKKLGSREKVTISKVGVAVGLKLNGKVVEEANVYVGSIATTPVQVKEAENILIGKSLNEETNFLMGQTISKYILNTSNRKSKYYKSKAVIGVSLDVLDLF